MLPSHTVMHILRRVCQVLLVLLIPSIVVIYRIWYSRDTSSESLQLPVVKVPVHEESLRIQQEVEIGREWDNFLQAQDEQSNRKPTSRHGNKPGSPGRNDKKLRISTEQLPITQFTIPASNVDGYKGNQNSAKIPSIQKKKSPNKMVKTKKMKQIQKKVPGSFVDIRKQTNLNKTRQRKTKIRTNVKHSTNNTYLHTKMHNNHTHAGNTNKKRTGNSSSHRKRAKKLILIYTPLHGHAEWYNLPLSKLHNFTAESKCRVQSCTISYDRFLLSKADVVVFHDRDMPDATIMYMLSRQRTYSQRWLFFTSETPKNTDHSLLPYNDLFNWTMTYKRTSDIVLPYSQYRMMDANQPRPDPNINYAKGRRRKIAWLVGNCKFDLRNEVAKELSKHTDVFIGGECRHLLPERINCSRFCPAKELDNYKFFLAMENGICTDYITEKYWRYLEMGLVPIVLSGADYSNPQLAIPGSYINIANFKSLKELAEYINYLDKNNTAYNEYFAWKQTYKIWHPATGDWPFESFWVCRLCEMLHENLPRKTYKQLSLFWDEQEDCELPENKITTQLFPKDYNWDQTSEEEEERAKLAFIPKEFDEA